jgi:hypothetical protein
MLYLSWLVLSMHCVACFGCSLGFGLALSSDCVLFFFWFSPFLVGFIASLLLFLFLAFALVVHFGWGGAWLIDEFASSLWLRGSLAYRWEFGFKCLPRLLVAFCDLSIGTLSMVLNWDLWSFYLVGVLSLVVLRLPDALHLVVSTSSGEVTTLGLKEPMDHVFPFVVLVLLQWDMRW